MLILSMLACQGPDDPGGRGGSSERTCDDRGDERMVVLQTLSFVRQEAGVSDGFDLDGAVTADGGASGCGIPDQVAPDGTPGIDNAFAYLLPALELTEAAAVESLIQQAIDDGRLLVTVELAELDDDVDDDCVDLVVGRGAGVPMVGTDGRLLPGQTIERDLTVPTYAVDDAVLADGTFEVPLRISLPITVFDVELDFQLLDGRLRGVLADDGTMSGVFAGGADVAYLLQIAAEENVDPALHDIVAGLLGLWSDLAQDETGACTQVSVTFAFEAVPAFFFEP